MKKKVVVVGLVATILAACQALSPPRPEPEPPCGYRGIDCGDGTCCFEGDVCGGPVFSGCAADMCCFVGPEGTAAAARPYKRRAIR